MSGLMYFPWSNQVRKDCLAVFQGGGLPILDIELTGKCSHGSCLYCDSVTGMRQDELTWAELSDVVWQAHSKGLQWIFICGLGEPLDSPIFPELLGLTGSLGVRVSFFTNGLGITSDLADLLRQAKACLLVKLDSLDRGTFDRLLGKPGTANRIYQVLEILLELGFSEPFTCEDGQVVTRLAASIVPTQLNLGDVVDVVRFCKANNMFPSIGELERAGRARKRFATLAVGRGLLEALRLWIDQSWGAEYGRPICPAAVFSLHLDTSGSCVIDEPSGLSCPWFRLTDPAIATIGSVRDCSVAGLLDRMIEYREVHRHALGSLQVDENVSGVFSGCGGEIQELVAFAEKHMLPSREGRRHRSQIPVGTAT